MNEFFERLNTAYESEYDRIANTDIAHDCELCEKFHTALRNDIAFRVLFNSLVEYRHKSGRYNARNWDDIPRYDIETTTGENAVYLAIINFGK